MTVSFVFTDCDGVLTDNRVLYPSGDRFFNVSDGHAFGMLKEAGVPAMMLTGEMDTSLLVRASRLDVAIQMACLDKLQAVVNLSRQINMEADAVAFMGNDVMDLPLLKNVGYPACPSDAHIDVLDYVQRSGGFVSKAKGGHGAFREFVDYLFEHVGFTKPDITAESTVL